MVAELLLIKNLFRYLKTKEGQKSIRLYVMQLSGSIIAAMPVQIAGGMRRLSNASTEAELVANAIKECSEAHQAEN